MNQKKTMKLLVAYDGSACAEAALDDLAQAGLPEEGEALIFSVAEVWLPPQNGFQNSNGFKTDPYIEQLIRKHRKAGEKALSEAVVFAKHAKKRFEKIFPRWRAASAATYGSPAWEILAKADEFKPDLIVVGSHGQTAVGRFFLGSISNKILTEAHSSVRVARGRIETDGDAPNRIVIGFDSSAGAQAAVEAVAARKWRAGSEIRLVSASYPAAPSAIGRFVKPIAHVVEELNQTENEWIEKLAEKPLEKLRDAGLNAALCIRAGNPKQILVEAAEQWGADCIFVGANAFGSRVERFLIGSTSASVAARAACSVEVVRKKS